jgi:cohesin complex subunit SCC1
VKANETTQCCQHLEWLVSTTLFAQFSLTYFLSFFLDTEFGDLGLVNELQIDSEEEDDDENREAIGEHTGNKWHKHTVKVLGLLQKRMRPPEVDDEDEEGNTKPTELTFQQMSQNCTRRTAASVFFELLQLKTWDFIELDQPEAYGDIDISAGVRFQEAPPNRA